jgi:hypothetical protein
LHRDGGLPLTARREKIQSLLEFPRIFSSTPKTGEGEVGQNKKAHSPCGSEPQVGQSREFKL